MSESASGEADSSTTASDKEFSCPTCGKSCNTRRGMHIHHATVHGQSLVREIKECPQCGEDFDSYDGQKYCSRACNIDSQRNQVERVCGHCGTTYTTKPSHRIMYCSKECFIQGGGNPLSGPEHAQYTENVTLECDVCGEEYKEIPSRKDRSKYCSKTCQLSRKLPEDHPFSNSGENHPAWKGGSANYNYGAGWKVAREKALKRDGYSCVVCGKGKEDLGRHPHVHHIRPVSDFESGDEAHYLLNLVTLCPKHHGQWEGIYLRPDPRG